MEEKVKKIIELLKDVKNYTVVYEKEEKLLKKNRSTKEKLIDEFPTVSGLKKSIKYNAIISTSFQDAINEARNEIGLISLEKTESSYESPYELVEGILLKHKKSGEYYINVYSQSIESSYEILSEDEIDLNYLLDNYGPVKKSKETLKEQQGLENPIICVTLKVNNIQSISTENGSLDLCSM